MGGEGSETILFDIASDEDDDDDNGPDLIDDSARCVDYQFGPEFLNYPVIGTTLEFKVGDKPLHNFRMIERHYFRKQLIVNFDFTSPFVIPNTRNTWEMIYHKPAFNDEWKAALINNPWETKSDSFYFVNDQLVMHNRANYSFVAT